MKLRSAIQTGGLWFCRINVFIYVFIKDNMFFLKFYRNVVIVLPLIRLVLSQFLKFRVVLQYIIHCFVIIFSVHNNYSISFAWMFNDKVFVPFKCSCFFSVCVDGLYLLYQEFSNCDNSALNISVSSVFFNSVHKY